MQSFTETKRCTEPTVSLGSYETRPSLGLDFILIIGGKAYGKTNVHEVYTNIYSQALMEGQMRGKHQNSKESTFAAYKLRSVPMNDGSVLVTFISLYLLSYKFSSI